MSDKPITWKYHPQEGYGRESLPTADAILLIYTGGTIGAKLKDPKDPNSPLDIAPWHEFEAGVPQLEVLRKKLSLRIDAVALDDPLDSTNITPEYWKVFVDIISDFYDDVMGFVLLHGTDTMVYTASALSFMLTGLDKPVVITGSQVPILDHPETDGTRNLVNAVRVAAWEKERIPNVGEVCIAFDKVLLRGTRARKVDADSMSGFASPNFPPLGELEEKITLARELLWTSKPAGFSPSTQLDVGVISFQVFPGIQTGKVLEQLLSVDDLKGAVLQAYGAGNAPTEPPFLDALERAIHGDNKKIIIDVTQCTSGSVRLGQYETGVGLMARGVLSGSDMTPEAALCKLMVLLGRGEFEGNVERFAQRSLVGEQSESNYISVFGPPQDGDAAWEFDADGRIDLRRSESDTAWQPGMPVASAWLHLHQAFIDTPADYMHLEVYFGLSGMGSLGEKPRGFAGDVTKPSTDKPDFLSIDVTKGVASLVPGMPPRVTIVRRTPSGTLTFRKATLVVVMDSRT